MNPLIKLLQMISSKGKRWGKTFRHDRSKWDPRDKLKADQQDFWEAKNVSENEGFSVFLNDRASPFSGTRRNRRAGKLKQQRIRERSDEDIIREIFEGLDG
jgi:hypothetical protein